MLTEGYGECKLIKCNHFVCIFYDDVFDRVLFVIFIDFFHDSLKYFDLLCQRPRPKGTHLELLQ